MGTGATPSPGQVQDRPLVLVQHHTFRHAIRAFAFHAPRASAMRPAPLQAPPQRPLGRHAPAATRVGAAQPRPAHQGGNVSHARPGSFLLPLDWPDWRWPRTARHPNTPCLPPPPHPVRPCMHARTRLPKAQGQRVAADALLHALLQLQRLPAGVSPRGCRLCRARHGLAALLGCLRGCLRHSHDNPPPPPLASPWLPCLGSARGGLPAAATGGTGSTVRQGAVKASGRRALQAAAGGGAASAGGALVFFCTRERRLESEERECSGGQRWCGGEQRRQRTRAPAAVMLGVPRVAGCACLTSSC